MADWQGRSNRDGLSSRARPNGDGHLQINVEGEFDFDKEIEGLRSQVGRLKHVCFYIPPSVFASELCQVTREIHNESQEQNRFLEQMVPIKMKYTHSAIVWYAEGSNGEGPIRPAPCLKTS